jgi:hypothetical protein
MYFLCLGLAGNPNTYVERPLSAFTHTRVHRGPYQQQATQHTRTCLVPAPSGRACRLGLQIRDNQHPCAAAYPTRAPTLSTRSGVTKHVRTRYCSDGGDPVQRYNVSFAPARRHGLRRSRVRFPSSPFVLLSEARAETPVFFYTRTRHSWRDGTRSRVQAQCDGVRKRASITRERLPREDA